MRVLKVALFYVAIRHFTGPICHTDVKVKATSGLNA